MGKQQNAQKILSEKPYDRKPHGTHIITAAAVFKTNFLTGTEVTRYKLLSKKATTVIRAIPDI
jgi:hypothetical protein